MHTGGAETAWLNAIETKTFDERGAPPTDRFYPLDSLLADGMVKRAGAKEPELRGRILAAEAEGLKRNMLLSGRQNVHVMCHLFSTSDSLAQVYGYSDLLSV